MTRQEGTRSQAADEIGGPRLLMPFEGHQCAKSLITRLLTVTEPA